MINSLLMLGSLYNKNKKLNVIFAIAWTIFMLFGANLKSEIGIRFTIINAIAFGVIFTLGKIFKGKYSNKVVAISSILIWSIIIDSICYLMYPQFNIGQNLLTYIGNGVLFNYKYVIYNILAVVSIECISYIFNLKLSFKSKKIEVFN